MRTPRVYSKQSIKIGQQLSLDKSACNYLASALRMTEGQQIHLFNGEGGEYKAEILKLNKNKGSVLVTQFILADRESPLQIHLAIGISRGERMDWLVQKATELGVQQVTPLFTGRTEVKLSEARVEKKRGHWQKIAISACEQCQRNTIPIIHKPLNFDQWLRAPEKGHKVVLHHRTEKTIAQLQNSPSQLMLLVGPEGGLSDTEINAALASGYIAAKIGPRVLRTETAPLAAISIAQSLWGDMG
ncbi:MAG: 16S rRNA (uracil(1498)-N(3))-methyltransferase [Porticoccaceae bacterium]|nr:16S rRNA (uracil(1498)-N(3))-methyltransferase [Porticoccaceae bacterium]MDG1475238.1 16S rRNA (uracil(1498)-N(3))-methyltransferase [Porticoccaceae bacterium]